MGQWMIPPMDNADTGEGNSSDFLSSGTQDTLLTNGMGKFSQSKYHDVSANS